MQLLLHSSVSGPLSLTSLIPRYIRPGFQCRKQTCRGLAHPTQHRQCPQSLLQSTYHLELGNKSPDYPKMGPFAKGSRLWKLQKRRRPKKSNAHKLHRLSPSSCGRQGAKEAGEGQALQLPEELQQTVEVQLEHKREQHHSGPGVSRGSGKGTRAAPPLKACTRSRAHGRGHSDPRPPEAELLHGQGRTLQASGGPRCRFPATRTQPTCPRLPGARHTCRGDGDGSGAEPGALRERCARRRREEGAADEEGTAVRKALSGRGSAPARPEPTVRLAPGPPVPAAAPAPEAVLAGAARSAVQAGAKEAGSEAARGRCAAPAAA